MIRTTVMNNIIEERYDLCKSLYLIKKETDRINKEKRKQGEKLHKRVDIFALPSHIKILFGPFMKTPLYTHLHTLEGYTGVVSCLTHHENKLYSGSADKTIRIWNTETYEEIATLIGQIGGVFCFAIHENKLYCGSWNNTIRIWNTETYEEIATVEGQTGWVYCLTNDENKLYSGSADKTIRIWNTETYEEIATLRGPRTNCILGVGIRLSAFGTQKLTNV